MSKVTTGLVVEAYQRNGGNITITSKELNVGRASVYHHLKKAGIDRTKKIVDGSVSGIEPIPYKLPKKSQVKRYILTSAQNNTHVHRPVWENLKALAKHYEAKIMVGTFSYNQNAYGKLSVKRGTAKQDANLWFDPEVEKYIVDERHELASSLQWCGEMNILPTAVNPLSGFETYTGRASSIFPQVKFAMRSIPSGRYEGTKFMYTTGTVTKRNYIQKREGLKAEHHHCFHPDTEFITDDGIKTLRETVGQSVKVWSGTAWEDAEIKSFGNQNLNEVVFAPAVQQKCKGTTVFRSQNSKLGHTVRVTPDHTWHLADGGTTNKLSVGDIIPASVVPPANSGEDFEEGVRHGLIFGDGSVLYQSTKDSRYSHQLCIHGDAAEGWTHLFNNITSWKSREHIENYKGTAYWKSAHNMKELPLTSASSAYVRGFFIGWLAADGHVTRREGSIQLCSTTKYALDWAVKMAPCAGFVVTGLCGGASDVTTFGHRRKRLWRLTLADSPRYWKVTSSSPIGTSEVMCAMVEPSHTFTLAGGLLTGNCYGGLLVEVDDQGSWWVRQLNATEDGIIYDLDVCVKNKKVKNHTGVEAITWGDTHTLLLDEGAHRVTHKILDDLTPKNQFVHDVMLGSVTDHWSRASLHERFRRYAKYGGWSDLREEIQGCVSFLQDIYRKGCTTYIVDSNHDRPWMEKWLDSNGREDPKNAMLWLELNLAMYQAMEAEPHKKNFHVIEHSFQMLGLDPTMGTFLREDGSVIITPAKIECGMHGHLGPDGTRGSVFSLAKMARKSNIGHCHKAGIYNGLYAAGVSCETGSDAWYMRGPSSWSHSHIVTYPTGKRTIVTVWKNKYRA